MTIKDFQILVADKTEYEYEKWFTDAAKHEICIGTVYIQCFMVSKSYVGLRDGTLYKIKPENKVREINRGVEEIKRRIIQQVDRLDVMNIQAIRSYLDLIEEKDKMERDIEQYMKSIEPPRDKIHCSCCGAHIDRVKKMVCASNFIYICDECVNVCCELMHEELPNDKRFTGEK